ncbi:MAG TPA: S-methyl-5-thioribose-1-phosphate isomerase [Dehalococcoidia bacterium]|nr:S-methyl-5-thioribose-1-phosphate isomerase [Dehalococcoidia bacterium]
MKPVEWLDNRIRIIDQTLLPSELRYLDLTDYKDMVEAIKTLRVRGAPAIGIAAAYGIALGAQRIDADTPDEFFRSLQQVFDDFARSRPTAVNLFYAIGRMQHAVSALNDLEKIRQALVEEAKRIHIEEEDATRRLSEYGAELIRDGFTILTHCNAGPLATAGYGTALGVIIEAKRKGKKLHVYVDETRPLLQGARLTTWELMQEGIPATLITDSMAGHFMHRGTIDCVITGADRIAANGDTANKIGTYSLAVLAHENQVPFYIAAPMSTVDISIKSGNDIPIEERKVDEVTAIAGVRVAPDGVAVANPAFDVTPHRYITAIITERGIIRQPYDFD